MGLWFVEYLWLSAVLTLIFSSPSPPRRDHIYTVDTDTANGDEIFFSKVSETSASLRTSCSRQRNP